MATASTWWFKGAAMFLLLFWSDWLVDHENYSWLLSNCKYYRTLMLCWLVAELLPLQGHLSRLSYEFPFSSRTRICPSDKTGLPSNSLVHIIDREVLLLSALWSVNYLKECNLFYRSVERTCFGGWEKGGGNLYWKLREVIANCSQVVTHLGRVQ